MSLRCINEVHAGTRDNPACSTCECLGRPLPVRAASPMHVERPIAEMRRRVESVARKVGAA